MRKFVIGLMFTVVPISQVAAASLSGVQIRSELVGKNIQWRTPNGQWHGWTLYQPNGNARLSNSNSVQGGSDAGTWRINGNQLCAAWKKLRNGEEGCFTVSRQADGTFLFSNGVVATVR